MNELGSEILVAPTLVVPVLPPDEALGSVPASLVVLTTAELAECTCPEFCERDHDLD